MWSRVWHLVHGRISRYFLNNSRNRVAFCPLFNPKLFFQFNFIALKPDKILMSSLSYLAIILLVLTIMGCQRRVTINLPLSNITTTDSTPLFTVTVNQAISETVGTCNFNAVTDPASADGFEYRVTFSEIIDPTSFTSADISNSGTGGGELLTWTIENCGDDTNFKMTATSVYGDGTIRPRINASQVLNLDGRSNFISTSTDNSVSFRKGWYQEAYIKAPNNGANDQFGYAISLYGDLLAVGTPLEDSNQTTITSGSTASGDDSSIDSGAVYIYRRTGANWQQEAYIKAVNAESGDRFGGDVSLSGDTLVVGARDEDSNQNTITNGLGASGDDSNMDAGAAYVYRRTAGIWLQEAYLKAANNSTNDLFGENVSIDGDTIVVGASLDNSNQTTITNGTTASSNNSYVASGAAFVYRRIGTSWHQEAYIKASNNGGTDWFSESGVVIDNDTIAVGSPFEQSNQTTITNGAGASADNSFTFAGAIYVYKRTGVNWAQEAYLKASNNVNLAGLSFDFSLNGDTIVSKSYDRIVTFKRTNNTWTEESLSNLPGTSYFVKNNTLIVGATEDSSNQTTITNGTGSSADVSSVNSGAVYVYTKSGINWIQEAYIKAPNNSAGDEFGSKIDLHGDTIAVSALKEASNQTTITNGITASSDNSNSDSGAVYVFRNKSRLFDIHDLRATSTNSSVTLTWSRTGGSATGYFVTYQAGATAPANCSLGTNVDVGDVATFTETPLSASMTYSFRVCATDGTLFSDGATITVLTLP